VDTKIIIERLVNRLLRGTISGERAVDRLLCEMGRGSRGLVVDQHLYGLDDELARLNYTTDTVEPGMSDPKIKKRLRNKVFVTINGRHFKNPKDLQKFRYGLIWIQTDRTDFKLLAKAVEAKLRVSNFAGNLMQTVRITNADL